MQGTYFIPHRMKYVHTDGLPHGPMDYPHDIYSRDPLVIRLRVGAGTPTGSARGSFRNERSSARSTPRAREVVSPPYLLLISNIKAIVIRSYQYIRNDPLLCKVSSICDSFLLAGFREEHTQSPRGHIFTHENPYTIRSC